jgi:hypothetical protein
MRANFIFRALLWVATIAAALGCTTAAAQSPEPKSVTDFFLLVPESYIGYDLPFREELLRGERRGAVIDIPNGYISWDASDNPEEFEFAIFRKSNGRYIVAFSVGYDSQFPQASRFLLLSYEGGRWRDVTKSLLPVAYDRKRTYKLPRQGRSIVVTDELGERPYTLTWSNDRFRLDRAAAK